MRSAVIRLMAVVFSLVLCIATGEATLRVIYRDAGRTTLGGPGGRPFDHLTVGNDLRGRRDTGPRRNIPRIMVIGDSITYGLGVHDWRLTWPEQLARRLEADSRPHDLAVFAMPGHGIVEHLKTLDREGPFLQPDILFFQWHVNDIEIESKRPDYTRAWQRWIGHKVLQRVSYLYFFLDSRAAALLPPPRPSYVDYLLREFAHGTAGWTEFERYFHSFATSARHIASQRIVLLYPQVPYDDVHLLKPIHDRMTAMARPHRLSIPAHAWIRGAGSIPVLHTREYYFQPGAIDLAMTLALDDAGADNLHVATLQVLEAVSNSPIASVPVTARGGARGPQTIPLHTSLPGTRGRWIRYRLESAGHTPWVLSGLEIDVDYDLQVVDLADVLNDFDTHVSIFDAHPNAAAQRVIADEAFKALNERRTKN